MELNTRPTLAQTIAAGGRLLAAYEDTPARGETSRRAVPAAHVPQQGELEESTDVPSPTGQGRRTIGDIALLFRCAPWTVTEHLQNGTLHGHVESGRWLVRGDVADAFLQGAAPDVQRRVCGCRALYLVRSAGAPARRPPH